MRAFLAFLAIIVALLWKFSAVFTVVFIELLKKKDHTTLPKREYSYGVEITVTNARDANL